MRVLLQRVARASVAVEGDTVAAIGEGLLLFAAIAAGDGAADLERVAAKIVHLRVFEDDRGRMNRSALDIVAGGASPDFGILVVSQFTLYGDVRKGRRPSFTGAAAPELAAPMIERFAAMLAGHGVPVRQGVFRAHMAVELVNDGPVTIWIDSDDPRREPGAEPAC